MSITSLRPLASGVYTYLEEEKRRRHQETLEAPQIKGDPASRRGAAKIGTKGTGSPVCTGSAAPGSWGHRPHTARKTFKEF